MQHLRHSSLVFVTASLLLAVPLCGADLAFHCTTPKSSTDRSKANTFVGLSGSQIATSLLQAGTPALMWGLVPSSSIGDACNLFGNTRERNAIAQVTGDSWAGPSNYTIDLQLVATRGCGAALDSSGTEITLTDPPGRKMAVVCPQNATNKGCGIYWTGSDVSSLYHQATGSLAGRRLQSTRKMLACLGIAGAGSSPVTGVAAGASAPGLAESAACLAQGPFAPPCGAGAVGVSAAVGSGAGCNSNRGCFPGDAQVMTELGEHRSVRHLAIGDKVGVMGPHNKVGFESIYAFGNQDAVALAAMVHLQLQNLQQKSAAGCSLTVTPLHFVSFVNGLHTRAENVNFGDLVWALDQASQTLVPHNVTGVSHVVEQGLYAPMTLGGTVIVNGVAASVHSEWFLDGLFDFLGQTHMLPSAYQAVLAPARAL